MGCKLDQIKGFLGKEGSTGQYLIGRSQNMFKGQVKEYGVGKVRGILYEMKLEREVGSNFFF